MTGNYDLTYPSDAEDCGVILYDRKTGAVLEKRPFPKKNRIGKLNRMKLTVKGNPSEYLYQFYEGNRRSADVRGKAFFAAKKYGEPKSEEDMYTLFETGEFDWGGSRNPRIPYQESLIYCLHVRGFTKHRSSGVKARGTFSGVVEKIPYLKTLGVTTLEFQPIYEYIEMPKTDASRLTGMEPTPKLNYWGYQKGYYYAPKAEYAADPQNAAAECRQMIRSLHENKMEAVLQFYFPETVNPMQIPDILRFWVEEYHVDGFHLIGENLPAELIAKAPELSETKIWYYRMEEQAVYGRGEAPAYKNLAVLRDEYLYDCRRFLKGDENCISQMMYHFRTVPPAVGRIHYLSTYWGFTLMDMVSYEFKHNEANGEDNHDGTDYNCSWNCGEEGYSRKSKVRKLRIQQLKNAYSLLLFSQSTPRIFMGDEFGNSQKGNNNPYCQDNETAWLNWEDLNKNRELYEFFCRLSKLRFSVPVLHPAEEAAMMDTISCGYPDLSFHGQTAWRAQMEGFSRQLGVMYCCLYGRAENTEKMEENEQSSDAAESDFLYLGINMHWENHRLAMPRLPKGQRWVQEYSTCDGYVSEPDTQGIIRIPSKTVMLYRSEKTGQEQNEESKVSQEQNKGSETLQAQGEESKAGEKEYEAD